MLCSLTFVDDGDTHEIEIPTPRRAAHEALRFGVEMTDDVPMTTQERAHSLPIWYIPWPVELTTVHRR